MKYCVTGASGLIGQSLCEQLLGQGHQVVAFCRTANQDQSRPGLTWLTGDIRDSDAVDEAVANCHGVFHLAALAAQWSSNPDDFHDINVTGTGNVLAALRKNRDTKLVFTSTAGVYGPSTGQTPITESFPMADNLATEYERTKAIAQKIVLAAADNQPAVVVNPTRVFGPGPRNESNIVAKIIQQYQRGWWRWLPGSGTSVGNYAFVNDVAAGHIAAMQFGRSGQCYLLGGSDLSFVELFDTIAKVTGKRRWLIPIPLGLLRGYARLETWKSKVFDIRPRLTVPFVNKYSRDYRVCCDKAVRELGYQITPIEQAIEATLRENVGI